MDVKKGLLPMLQNSKGYISIRRRMPRFLKYNIGVTLIELLVAMAILSILLAGLVMMFTSAIESTLQGYMIKDNYDNARTAMEVLSRDLQRACALANRGENIQFYGTPTSFTFLTLLDNGMIGRVTYFFAPSPFIPPFETWGAISPDEIKKRNSQGRTRLEDIIYMKKLINKIPNVNFEKIIGDIPDVVVDSLPSSCNITDIINKLDTLSNAGNLFSEVNMNPVFDGDEQAYRVLVQPLALFRIEEKGQSNIIDVNTHIFPQPQINTVDNPFAVEGYTEMDSLLHAFLVENLGSQSNINVLSRVDLQVPNIQIAKDLRNYVDNPNYQTIDKEFIKNLIDMRKVELRLLLMQVYNPSKYCVDWYNLLLNPINRSVISGGEGTLNLGPYIWCYDLSISRKDQAYLYLLFTGGTGNITTQSRLLNFWEASNLNPEDYVLADGFGARAFWIDEANTFTTATDLLYPGAIFSYQSEENITAMYFNDVRNIPLYMNYLSSPPESISEEEIGCATAFLDRIWTEMRGTDPSKTAPFASIFFDRLPVRITISAWIMSEKPRPGISDFRRWFSQSIDIPCGLRTPQQRRMPAGM